MSKAKRPHRSKSQVKPSKPAKNKGQEAASLPPDDKWSLRFVVAVLALCFARTLFPSESAAISGDGMPWATACVALLTIWCFVFLTQRQRKFRWGVVDWFALGLILWQATSVLWKLINPNSEIAPRPALNMLWEWIALFSLYVILRQTLHGWITRIALCTLVSWTTALSCVGYYQSFVALPEARAFYEQNPQQALLEAGIGKIDDPAQISLFENRLYSNEPLATFSLTNSLAGYLLPWLLVGWGLLLAPSSKSSSPGWLLSGRLLVPLSLILGCLLLTKSRAACLSAALAAMVLLTVRFYRLLKPTSRRIVAAGVILALGMLIFVSVTTSSQIVSEAAKSMRYRLEYWQATIAMVGDYPLLGVGLGNFQMFYPPYMVVGASETVADPHNFLLEVCSTAGIPALLLLLGLIASQSWQLIRNHLFTRNLEEDAPPGIMKQRVGPLAGISALTFGPLLAYSIGPLVSVPPSAGNCFAALVIACGAFCLMWPIFWETKIPAIIPVVAWGGLMVNLLAAGGIGLPSVAQSWWILLAILAGDSFNKQTNKASDAGATEPTTKPSSSPRQPAGKYALLAVTLLLTGVCYTTAFRPTVARRIAISRAHAAFANADLRQGIRSLEEAAQLDVLSAEPWHTMAQVAFGQWQQTKEEARWFEVARYLKETFARQPRAAGTYREAGDWYLQHWRYDPNPQSLAETIRLRQKFVELHPTSSIAQAELAWVLHLANRSDQAAKRATIALDIDTQNSHAERALEAQFLSDPTLDRKTSARHWMLQLRKGLSN